MSFAGDLTRRQRGADLVRRRVAFENQPLPAAQHMLPELTMRTLRVVEEEDVIVPDLRVRRAMGGPLLRRVRSEEHTSELQSLMRTSYAVFCLKKKTKHKT